MRARVVLTATVVLLAALGSLPARADHAASPVVLMAQGEELDAYTPGAATTPRDAAAFVNKDQWVNGTPCFNPDHPDAGFVEADDNPFFTVVEPGGKVSNGDAHPFWGVFNHDGSFTGQTIPHYDRGEGFDLQLTDPAGCLFQPHTDNLLLTDVGSNHTPTQGNGKLVEFFAPSYDTYCVIDPTISQAGFPTWASNGDLLVPHTGEGSIYRYANLPASASNCATATKNPWFVSPLAGTPIAIVPVPGQTDEYAVSSVLAPSDIVQVKDLGQAGVVDGVLVAPGPSTGTPFGLAYAPNGDLYYADLGITFFPGCVANPSDPTCLANPIDSGAGQSSLMVVHADDPLPQVACSNCDNMDFADGIAVVPSRYIEQN